MCVRSATLRCRRFTCFDQPPQPKNTMCLIVPQQLQCFKATLSHCPLIQTYTMCKPLVLVEIPDSSSLLQKRVCIDWLVDL